ncbi:hypothetical protein NQ314_003073 [Rhamnusium bicolor]|uniref:Uncharacterized protein n=1 Tax=Rhamnusium bicolor TaxID=1586634 RepID=A0AAV8ZPL7_9CUCU|nr:hypothetical protein NQ314_003073 [Rhamnusium bicolor]
MKNLKIRSMVIKKVLAM